MLGINAILDSMPKGRNGTGPHHALADWARPRTLYCKAARSRVMAAIMHRSAAAPGMTVGVRIPSGTPTKIGAEPRLGSLGESSSEHRCRDDQDAISRFEYGASEDNTIAEPTAKEFTSWSRWRS